MSKFPTAVLLASALVASSAYADLRGASTPKQKRPDGTYTTINQGNAVQFTAGSSITYCEPSTFGYQGLVNQRQNNYDNFLRSNIDNEQDNRNFNNEPGMDHLPFRTFEAVTAGANCTIPTTTMVPGTSVSFPLRWNNPHASEIEANVWLMSTNPPVVVPVLQPVCSGEGIQDSVVGVTIPADFNTKVRATVPGFNGCQKAGDCVLQLYAHSVETRQYAIGIPLIVSGYDATAPAARDASAIKPAPQDVQYNLDALPRKTCLSQADPSAKIASAAPQYARLISDVANHAYQNSDYSPYSGQQATRISRNMQAAALVRMVISNGGELGKSVLTDAQKAVIQKLTGKVNGLVAAYEKAADEVIKKVGEVKLKTSTTLYGQQTANCFRCPEKVATNSNRQNTQTYIPSFTIPVANVAEARSAISNAAIRTSAVQDNGDVLIYETVLNQVRADFKAAEAAKVVYKDAVLKTTVRTMADVTQFRKRDASGKQDGGKYAATMFYKSQEEKPSPSPSASASIAASSSPSSTPAPSEIVLPSTAPGSGLTGNPDDGEQQDTPLNDGGDATNPLPSPSTPATGAQSSASTVSASLASLALGALAALLL